MPCDHETRLACRKMVAAAGFDPGRNNWPFFMFVLFPALFIAATVRGQTKQNILQETCIASALINNVTNYLFVYTSCRTLICTRDPSAKERARTPESAKGPGVRRKRKGLMRAAKIV